MQAERPFRSYFMGGFECSSHRRKDGRRLDLLDATKHDRFADADYRQLYELGLRTVRDGLRWHLIETSPHHYDWSSFLPMLRASEQAGVQVIWDLCHYGWPDDLDIWSPAFPDRFGRFAAEAARIVREETDAVPFYCPVNEMSFWAWAGGEVGRMNPGARKRGGELKRQLVRTMIAAIEAVRAVDGRARFVSAEPIVHVASRSSRRKDVANASPYHAAQYEAYDLLSGRLDPELGGRPEYLDILGANFYPDNQWFFAGGTIPLGHHAYRPFRDMLTELYERYRRPIVISETGAEGSAKPSWLHYVCAEVRAAHARGVPVEGICLYPVLDYPGWDNGRCCEVGLLGLPDESGRRTICEPLLEELERQQIMMDAQRAPLPDMAVTGRSFSMVSDDE